MKFSPSLILVSSAFAVSAFANYVLPEPPEVYEYRTATEEEIVQSQGAPFPGESPRPSPYRIWNFKTEIFEEPDCDTDSDCAEKYGEEDRVIEAPRLGGSF